MRGQAFRTFEDVHATLREVLEEEPRDDVWQELVEDHYVEPILTGEDDAAFARLVERYKRQAHRYPATGRKQSGVPRGRPAADPTGTALGQLFALDAAADEDVVAFRRDVLGGQLLPPEQVHPWISEVFAREGGTRYISVPFPHELKVQRRGHARFVDRADLPSEVPVRELTSRVLRYVSAGREGASAESTAYGGVLDRLRDLSRSLERSFRWSEASACNFVLTGIAPPVTTADWRVTFGFPYYATDRITLNLSPQLSPKAVAQLYSNLQRQLSQLSPLPLARRRHLTEKHSTLAVFTHEHRHLGGMKWDDIRRLWNQTYPAWTYERMETFARDADQAWGRLTGQRLEEE